MQTIGERLEEARKRKGISIREAAENTKIRGDYLQKFEANTFEIGLPALYIRGFLRSYSRYLDLDPVRIINDFNTILAEGKPARRETREVYGRVDFAETARSKDAGEATPATRAAQDQALVLKYGLLALGAIVAVVIIIFLIKVLFSGATPKAPQPTSPPTQQIAQPNQTREAIFTITVIEPTRIRVVDDDKTVFLDGKYPMNRGETKMIRYSKDLLVTIEHPDRIRIELNGRAVSVPVTKSMGQFRVPYEAP